MKKYFKYFLYGLIYLILIFVFAIMFIVTAPADIIKPNNGIEPYQVVKIQLRSLKNNDEPFKNAGIEQTWEFAHPNNKKFTGPLDKFQIMLKGKSYSMLLNHKDHKIKEVFLSDKVATFEVIILDTERKYYKFKWQLQKYNKEGPLKDSWLTTAVSQPVAIGSSI